MEKRIGEVGSVIVDNRERTNVTGVIDVIGFDDVMISLNTNLGGLILQGRGFKISTLNVETGELVVDGVLDSFSYEDIDKKKGGLLSRMFR